MRFSRLRRAYSSESRLCSAPGDLPRSPDLVEREHLTWSGRYETQLLVGEVSINVGRWICFDG